MKLVLAFLGCAAVAIAAQPSPSPVTYDEAVANERRLFTADQAHDMDTIQDLVADDFVDIAPDGTSSGKAALLKEIPTIKLLTFSQRNFRVTALGSSAYEISYDSDAMTIGADGKQSRSQNALNSIWIRRDERWQMLMHCRGDAQALRAH